MADKKIVLVIEDSLQDAELLRQIVLKVPYDFEAVLAESAEEAVRYLNEAELGKCKKPVLLFLDLFLPGITGLDFLKAFHHNPSFKNVTVIVLTGSEDKQDFLASYKNGAAFFMKKPYKIDDILGVLGQLKVTGRF